MGPLRTPVPRQLSVRDRHRRDEDQRALQSHVPLLEGPPQQRVLRTAVQLHGQRARHLRTGRNDPPAGQEVGTHPCTTTRKGFLLSKIITSLKNYLTSSILSIFISSIG